MNPSPTNRSGFVPSDSRVIPSNAVTRTSAKPGELSSTGELGYVNVRRRCFLKAGARAPSVRGSYRSPPFVCEDGSEKLHRPFGSV